MKEYSKKFYNSKAWRRCRKLYIISQYSTCERCGYIGSIVHHKVYITPSNINDSNITLNYDNLELLCIDCHNKEHMGSGNSSTEDELSFDSQGNLIYSPPY